LPCTFHSKKEDLNSPVCAKGYLKGGRVYLEGTPYYLKERTPELLGPTFPEKGRNLYLLGTPYHQKGRMTELLGGTLHIFAANFHFRGGD